MVRTFRTCSVQRHPSRTGTRSSAAGAHSRRYGLSWTNQSELQAQWSPCGVHPRGAFAADWGVVHRPTERREEAVPNTGKIAGTCLIVMLYREGVEGARGLDRGPR